MFKTKAETLTFLQKLAVEKNQSLVQTATDVIEDYGSYDWQGEDRLFLAFCEEIIEDEADRFMKETEELEFLNALEESSHE
jgi:hypothetical protein